MLPFDPAAHSLLYAGLAGCCMLLTLRLAREVLVPVGALLRPAAALACAGLAAGAALVLVVAAVVAR